MSLVGRQIGSIRIDRPLGEGGMGEVYLGFDEELERWVAVKTRLASQRLDAEAKARLVREARLLSKVGRRAEAAALRRRADEARPIVERLRTIGYRPRRLEVACERAGF